MDLSMPIISGAIDIDSDDDSDFQDRCITVTFPEDANFEGTICHNSYFLRAFLEHNLECLASEVLSYLTAKDLCRIGSVSKYFAHLSRNSSLWHNLHKIDFTQQKLSLQPMTKEVYAMAYKNWLQWTNASTLGQASMVNSAKKEYKSDVIRCVLDFIQIQLFVPLSICCVLMTLILVALKTDGSVTWSIWYCLFPMYLLCFYVAISLMIACYVRRTSEQSGRLMYGMWQRFQSPWKLLTDGNSFNTKKVAVFCALFFLVVLQFILLSVKLSPGLIGANSFPWGLVFLPTWFLFTLFCAMPCVGVCNNGGLYAFMMLVMWMPLLVMFVCLAVKLEGITSTRSHARQDRRIRLALIFIPFWIIEGAFLLSSTALVYVGYRRQQLGYENAQLGELIGAFLLIWGFFCPMVATQVMLCLRDEHMIRSSAQYHISLMDTLTPVLVLVGWILLMAIVVVYKYKTPFQMDRIERNRNHAGDRVLFSV